MTLESLPVTLFVWAACATVLAGMVQGAIGFGFPFVATPLIAMASDMRTAVILLVLPTLVLNFINLATSGPLLPALRRFWMMPLYALVGAFAGTWLFVTVPDAPYALFLALITFVYLNFDRFTHGAWPHAVKHERAFGVLAGGAAGVFEGTVNVAGPPLIIYYLSLGLAPAMLVQSLTICFVVGKVMQFTVLTAHGGVTVAEWAGTLPLIAISVAAFFVGLRVRNRIDAPTYRRWVKRALFVIAAVLLAQYGHSRFA